MTIGVNLPSDSIYNTYSSSRYFVWQSAVTIHIPPRPRSNIRPPIPSSPFHFLLPRIFLLREKVHRKLIQNINNIPNQRTLFRLSRNTLQNHLLKLRGNKCCRIFRDIARPLPYRIRRSVLTILQPDIQELACDDTEGENVRRCCPALRPLDLRRMELTGANAGASCCFGIDILALAYVYDEGTVFVFPMFIFQKRFVRVVL
jgi:hypothetical protein